MGYDYNIAKKGADAIRVLSAEAIQKAKSGHPGMPLGCADFAFTLWSKYLRFNPSNPKWLGRDRFVLSAGHGSMLIYSLLHLFGFGLDIEELKNFRQWGSLTPGHPEFGHTAGVDITTGPLGSGFSSAIGMAIARRHFIAQAGEDIPLASQKIYVMCGDGCMEEGCTNESASLAGTLKLDEIIVFYDDNSISIEGDTKIAFTEDVGARFAALGWRVLKIADANDARQCDEVLAAAQNSDGRPTLIIGKTKIGFGAPTKQGKANSHGEPLGDEELAGLKKNLGYDLPPFTVPDDVKAFCASRIGELKAAADAWEVEFQKFLDADASRAQKVYSLLNCTIPENIEEELLKAAPVDKPVATRASSGAIIQKVSELVPSLFGGSADLSPSTKTNIKDGGEFSAENRAGKNLHFGVRELGMGLAANGMALYGATIPYSSTFFVFSDYMKPAIRLAALQKLHEIYVFTHDSFYVGEDGPTHEPIEQIAMLRTIPGLTVIRPAEAHEVAQAWAVALKAEGPVAMLMTRQNLEPYAEDVAAKIDVSKGAFVVSDEEDFEILLIATGSEVNLALKSAELLRAEDYKVRVVSMPSQELFLAQPPEYQNSVIPFDQDGLAVVSIEAGTTFGWDRFVGLYGLPIGLDHFGASAPYKVLAEKFGFTPEAVVAQIKEYFTSCECDCDCDGECNCDCDK
ncbi:MAG: transketolase [Victivallaceae bacterium]|nr:transketolase [Victivallaceae bacterium]